MQWVNQARIAWGCKCMLRGHGRIRTHEKCQEDPPPPRPPPPPSLSNSPEKNFLWLLRRQCTVCFSGSCSGCDSAVHIEYHVPIEMDCHELMLSCCGHRVCHKFIPLNLPCTVTFVDKGEGQPSMGFCYAKKLSGAFGAEHVWESCGKEEGQPPPPPWVPPPHPLTPPPFQCVPVRGLNHASCFIFGTGHRLLPCSCGRSPSAYFSGTPARDRRACIRRSSLRYDLGFILRL